jgi:hypothetical protein
MLVYITDYTGEMSGQDLGPEAGRYGRNYVVCLWGLQEF